MRPETQTDYRDEVSVLQELTHFLRANAPAKPVLIGEFGLATPQWGLSDAMKTDVQGVHFRRSLWASAFAGSSGTALFWWWEQLDRQNAYQHYRPLSRYFEGVSFAGMKSADTSIDSPIRVLGYQATDRAYLWLNDPRANWHKQVIEGQSPEPIADVQLTVRGLDRGTYRVIWWNTQSGTAVSRSRTDIADGSVTLAVPTFTSDIACKIERLEQRKVIQDRLKPVPATSAHTVVSPRDEGFSCWGA
jgi:hypothetical protein